MDKQTIDNKINRMIELKKEIKVLQDTFDTIKDSLKKELDETGLERLEGHKLYCYYKDITRNVVDNDKLIADNLYNKYLKVSESKQFNYNVIK